MVIKSKTFADSLGMTRKLRFYMFRVADLLLEKLGKPGYFNTTYKFFSKLKRNQVSFEDGGNGFRIEFQSIKFIIRKYTSDEQVFIDVIIDGEYDVAIDFAKKNMDPVTRIIDAGANCGLTSIRFASQFPNACIIALEPDKNNYKALVSAVTEAGFGKAIDPVNAAFSTEDGFMSEGIALDDREWGKVFRKVGDGGLIKGVTLRTLMAEKGWDFVDILKLDVEGAELDLFGDPDFRETLEKVTLIVMEIHDNGIRKENIHHWLSTKGFIFFEHVHLTIAIQKTIFK